MSAPQTPDGAREAWRALGSPETLCALRHMGARRSYWVRVATTEETLTRVFCELDRHAALAVFRGGKLATYTGGCPREPRTANTLRSAFARLLGDR